MILLHPKMINLSFRTFFLLTIFKLITGIVYFKYLKRAAALKKLKMRVNKHPVGRRPLSFQETMPFNFFVFVKSVPSALKEE